MSLRVWLPLTKDLRNQGLNGATITNTGATYSATGGKLGGCYVFDGTDDALNVGNLSTIVDTDFSFTCWFYKDEWGSKGYETIFGGSSGFELESKVGATNSPVLKLYNWGGGSCTYELSKWNHIVFTRNTTETKLYLNGELAVTGTAGTIPNHDYFVGAWNSATQQNFKGKMCDVRIYDHALSLMEVKQLSQGLVLHYPLNRNGWGQENLITQTMIDAEPWKSAISGNYTIDGKTGWILSNSQLYSKSGNGANNIFSGLTYEANTQYTISFKWRDDYRTDGKSSSLYIRFKYSDGTYSQVISSKDYNYWKEEVMTSTAGKTVSAITTTYGNGGNLLFTDLKLEKGTIKTPTSPITNSDLYNLMGLNSTTEYDCSGFCNNGTRTGTFSWTSDTPKYAVSTYFADYTQYISSSLGGYTPDAITMSCWVKTSNTSPRGGYHIPFNVHSTDFEMSIAGSSGKARLGYVVGGSRKVQDVGPNIEDGQWHMMTSTYDGTAIKRYVDGELVNTESATGALSTLTTVGVGAFPGATTYGNTQVYESDCRIYATALSASDVKSLYQNCATIDADGTIHGQIRS